MKAPGSSTAVHGFRYQVKEVASAVAFYAERLGFRVKHQQLPAFANVALGGMEMILERHPVELDDAHRLRGGRKDYA